MTLIATAVSVSQAIPPDLATTPAVLESSRTLESRAETLPEQKQVFLPEHCFCNHSAAKSTPLIAGGQVVCMAREVYVKNPTPPGAAQAT